MTTKTRQIRGEKYNVATLVDEALTAVAANDYSERSVLFNLERRMVTAPTEAQVAEMAFLDLLARTTGANFQDQFGRGLIDLSSREAAVATVNGYLNRRVAGQRSRWGR